MRTNPTDKIAAENSPGASVVTGEQVGNTVILEPINFIWHSPSLSQDINWAWHRECWVTCDPWNILSFFQSWGLSLEPKKPWLRFFKNWPWIKLSMCDSHNTDPSETKNNLLSIRGKRPSVRVNQLIQLKKDRTISSWQAPVLLCE